MSFDGLMEGMNAHMEDSSQKNIFRRMLFISFHFISTYGSRLKFLKYSIEPHSRQFGNIVFKKELVPKAFITMIVGDKSFDKWAFSIYSYSQWCPIKLRLKYFFIKLYEEKDFLGILLIDFSFIFSTIQFVYISF